ncbi:MAG: hypothetical protein LUD00_09675 [Prevotellaceae bacterium]|nr:hypothetical protein [Prevotellaceae bacterium]
MAVSEVRLNKNLKAGGSWAVFGHENGRFSHNLLVINILLKRSKLSKKLRPARFFERFL